ncbi:MAG: hypothetical protein DCC53_11745 [Chloroflexi bacterium]|nr:MAG: hypothetical protein DCC53_11745 [Chloroflexota bacterium]
MDTANRQHALFSILSRLPSRLAYYGSALGAVALAAGANLPPELVVFAGGIGVNILSNMIDRAANGEGLTDSEIERSTAEAIEKSGIQDLLKTEEFWAGYSRLFRRLGIIETAIRENELEIVRIFNEQFGQCGDVLTELGEAISEIAEDVQILLEDQAHNTHQQDEVIALLLEILKTVTSLAASRSPSHEISSHEANVYSVLSTDGPVSKPREFNLDRDAIMESFRLASTGLTNIRNTIYGTDITIQRTEANNLVDWALGQSNNDRLALLRGKPGQGKSVVMQQTTIALQTQDLVVLGIKADKLTAPDHPIVTQEDLSVALHLPATIEECVRFVASDRTRCVVLIDQLDTLALTLNSNEQSLRVLVQLIDRVSELPNVYVIVSVRDFDLNVDPTLASVKASKHFQVNDLDEAKIEPVLSALGLPEYVHLPKSLQRLIRVPLYLDIYAQTISESDNSVHNINTLQDLYRRLWELRIDRHEPGSATPAERLAAVYYLVDQMMLHRTLTVHTSMLDTHSSARSTLLGNGFIIAEGHTIGFLHQTLFSYCFARKFISDGRDLTETILEGPQGFFDRQLLGEVLTHLRATDPQQYGRHLTALLFQTSQKQLRFHLRLLLIKWLATRTDPLDAEYNAVLRFKRLSPNDFVNLLRAIGSSAGWFERLRLHLPSWLADNDVRVCGAAVDYLIALRDRHTAFALELILPYCGQSDEWDNRISTFLINLKDWSHSVSAIDQLLDYVRRGKISARWSRYTLRALAASQLPESFRLVQLYVDISIAEYRQNKETQTSRYPSAERAFDIFEEDYELCSYFDYVLRTDPRLAVKYLLPQYIRIAEEISSPSSNPGLRFASSYRFLVSEDRPGRSPDEISMKICIFRAMLWLASNAPDEFRTLRAKLKSKELETIQRLLLYAMSGNPSEYAAEVNDYLAEDQRRLRIHPEAGKLIGGIYGLSDPNQKADLDELILQLPNEEKLPERTLESWRRRLYFQRVNQFSLLRWIPIDSMSNKLRRFFQQLRRLSDFSADTPERRSRVRFVEIETPIAPDAQRRLSDTDWLRIMRHFDEDRPRRGLDGGMRELIQSMHAQVKEKPERFYALSHQFDDTIPALYSVTLIGSFSTKEIHREDWVFDLFRRFAHRIVGPHRAAVCSALLRIRSSSFPDDILHVISDWAVNDPDPDPQEETKRIPEIVANTTSVGDGLINRAINTVRGVALETLCEILFEKSEGYLDKAYEHLVQGARDSCASVKAIAIDQLITWHNRTGNWKRAVELFEEALRGHPVLLVSRRTQNYLHWLSHKEPAKALPYVRAMIDLPHENTQDQASQIICLAGLREREGFNKVAESLHLSPEVAIRRGAATIYAQQIGDSRDSWICTERLLMLMRDADTSVRAQACRCFHKMRPGELSSYIVFIEEFFRTPALEEGADDFSEFLVRSDPVTRAELDVVIRLVEKFLDIIGTDIGNYNKGYLRVERDVTIFLRKMFDQSHESDIQNRIMDLFDKLLQNGAHEAHKLVAAEDAEWFR